jgi:putative transposase
MARYDPDVHHRRSIRLKSYDYSQEGVYYVTICTQQRECLFGEVRCDEMQLSHAGRAIQMAWEELPRRFEGVDLDAFVVMPNHVHGILVVFGGPGGREGRDPGGGEHKVRPHGTLPGTVGRIVQAFKSISTLEYAAGVKQYGWPSFQGRLWQRNYYEHIIRDEETLNLIREYISTNPARWAQDHENPARVGVTTPAA